ncbi:MAG: cytochrome c oxidase cbb3-type subunit [Actinomycetota bacterium]|nr:cytochrome c oxidase cbb3-type subunit [Actinomycetota bacterium]
METSDIFLVAAVVLVPAALLWAIFVARSGGMGGKRRPSLGIPAALRPAPSDEKLEGRRLERLQTWGLIATLASAIFIPAYWLPEKDRQEHFTERFQEEAVHRGRLTFLPPPVLPEGVGSQEFKELEEGIALGQNCARCHGAEAQGGPVDTGFVPPGETKRVEYQAPPLNNVFTRWDEEMVRFTIERGRPGTPMPPWGVAFGGSMTTQMIDDVMAWLHTLPENNEPPAELASDATGKEIFEARCAVCHGDRGEGKEVDTLWHQGMALWKGDVLHLTEIQHRDAILGVRRWGFMPSFAEAPPVGVPVAPYPLTAKQIEAVMAYERTL